MVAGKVRAAMGLQKSPANSKSETPTTPPKPPLPPPRSGKGATFSRTFGAYFPRSSAQVQPRPPDVTEVLKLVEELRDRESRLKTELLEFKLLNESVAIVPVLESQIAEKNWEVEIVLKKAEFLESDNEKLKTELNSAKLKLKESERKVKAMEAEIVELKTASYRESEDSLVSSSSSLRFHGLMEASTKSSLIKNLKKEVKCTNIRDSNWEGQSQILKPFSSESKREVCNSEEFAESTQFNHRSRVPRVPKPPPKRSLSSNSLGSSPSNSGSDQTTRSALPPPPPPPPVLPRPSAIKKPSAAPPPPPPLPKGTRIGPAKVRRIPEVVEFYHSLMRRDSRRGSGGGPPGGLPAAASARDMIGEIENRSAYSLAIKTDVEVQGDFIRFLIKEVEYAAFTEIEDVVPFVKWLDDELSHLVDERAVLKHFDWPEHKADALREAAFGYSDLKKLESEASSFGDDPRHPCASVFKKMRALLEKLEHGVYNLSRMKESATNRYKSFRIPVDWMLETGVVVSQIKLASVKLAMKYMKRVSAELEAVGSGPEEEELIVQGVRFAFRVHQFAGGFDVETMRAFQELRDKAKLQYQNQQQQKLVHLAN